MKRSAIAALAGGLLVLPFVVLQARNVSLNAQNAPGLIALYTILWLLPTAALMIVMRRRLNAVVKIGVVIVLAAVWGNLVVDQWPCFLGVPNCD